MGLMIREAMEGGRKGYTGKCDKGEEAGYYHTPLQKSGQAMPPLHCENRNYHTGVFNGLETEKEVLLAAFIIFFVTVCLIL